MAFTHLTLTRDYDFADGNPPIGLVTFTPSAWLVNAGVVVPPTAVAAKLDVEGRVTVALVANTDPGTTPVGSYYTVREEIVGQPERSYRIIVSYDIPSPADLSYLAGFTIVVGTEGEPGGGDPGPSGYGIGYGVSYGQ